MGENPGGTIGGVGNRIGGGSASNIDVCPAGPNIDMIDANGAFCWSVWAPPPLGAFCGSSSIAAGQVVGGGGGGAKAPQEFGAGGTVAMAAPIVAVVWFGGVPTVPTGAVMPSGKTGASFWRLGGAGGWDIGRGRVSRE